MEEAEEIELLPCHPTLGPTVRFASDRYPGQRTSFLDSAVLQQGGCAVQVDLDISWR
jgi:hypothetical protein